MWKSTVDSERLLAPYGVGNVRRTADGRILVLDDRGFWIAVNINKSVPSWKFQS